MSKSAAAAAAAAAVRTTADAGSAALAGDACEMMTDKAADFACGYHTKSPPAFLP
jgi:hypothetical protein